MTTGSDWEHVMKVEIFLKRMEDFDKINVIYEKVRAVSLSETSCPSDSLLLQYRHQLMRWQF